MISLAQSNLIHDWRRSLAVVSILALLGTLILVQVGLPMHMVKSFMRSYSDTNADLFATGTAGRFFRNKALSSRHEGFLWMHENVKHVEPSASNSSGTMFIDDDTSIQFSTLTVNPSEDSLTYPKRLGNKIRLKLYEPGNIVLSTSTQQTYNLNIGDRPTINGHSVVIVGFVEDLGEVFSRKVILMSLQTARMVDLGSRRQAGSYLIALKNPELLQETQKELQTYVQDRQIRIYTPVEIIANAENTFLMERSAQQNIFVAIFALIVGVAVATQTMRSGVLAQLKEYGALRALGVGLGGISKTIIEQAFWTGLCSIPAMIGLSYVVKAIVAQFSIGLAFPSVVLIACSAMIMLVAMLAGLLSLPVLYKADPAELMR